MDQIFCMQVVVNPITGEKKTKKRLGGAYPGQRPPQHAPYTPSNGIARFVSYGGGNALTLIQENVSTAPEIGGKAREEYIKVTLPVGVRAGQKIHVQAPDGRLNEIIIPPGFGPGNEFLVQFSDTAPAPSAPVALPSNRLDSGGFANVLDEQPEIALPVPNSNGVYGDYPTSTATPVYPPYPVYSSPPKYPSY